jgi:hypothetical protein
MPNESRVERINVKKGSAQHPPLSVSMVECGSNLRPKALRRKGVSLLTTHVIPAAPTQDSSCLAGSA